MKPKIFLNVPYSAVSLCDMGSDNLNPNFPKYGVKSGREAAGFLQVRESWKKSANFSGERKVREKYYFFWKCQGK